MLRPHYALALTVLLACTGCKDIYTVVGVTTPPPAGAVTAKAKFLYTGSSKAGAGAVSAFSIAPSTGALTEIPGSPFAVGTSPVILASDSTNHYLAVADISTFRTYLYTIDANGKPDAPITSVYTLGRSYQPNSLIFNPGGTRLYQANAVNGAIGVFNVVGLQGQSVLESLAGSPFAVIPNSPVLGNALAFKADGRVLYELDTRAITALAIDGTGAPSVLQTLPLTYGYGIAIDPLGKYLYVADGNTLAAYSVDAASGTLALAHTTPTGTSGTYSFTVSPKGDLAFVSTAGAGTAQADQLQLVSYTVSNGVFTPIGARKGVFAQQMAVDPSGGFLYVPEACQTCSAPMTKMVDQFTVANIGAIAPITSGPSATTPGYPLGIALSGSR